MLKKFSFSILLLLFCPLTVLAADGDAYIHVRSDPSPAIVVFQGKPKSVMHETPAQLELAPNNFFKIQLTRKGYERNGGYIGFKRFGTDSLNTFIFGTQRQWAVARSMIFPGWGQRYASYGKKGFWFGAFTLGSGAYTGYVHFRYKAENDDLSEARNRWQNSLDLEERNRLWQDWGNQYLETERFYEQRQVWTGLTGYFYAINLLDAIFLTPMFDGQVNNSDTVHFKMSKKTPFKALMRSALIPGWGHHYVGSKNKGWMYGLLCAAGTYFTVDFYLDYKDQVARYDLSQDYYRFLINQGRPIDELEIAFATVKAEEREADDDFRKLQWAAGITAGVWALNVIDMVFSYRTEEILTGQFFTENDRDDKIRLGTEVQPDMASVVLHVRF